jgi:hypothetical protein
MEVSSQLHAQVKRPWYPLDRRLGEPQSRSVRSGAEKNFQPLPGLEPPIIQPVAQRYTTELSRFQVLKQICMNCLLLLWSRDSSVSIVTRLRTGRLGFRFRQGPTDFSLRHLIQTAMGSTQPPTQWIPGTLYDGVKWLWREANHSSLSCSDVKQCVELYFHSPIRLHGVVLH